ncbi:MAG: hypothetical protein PUE84_05835 [Firmicutes bacterium]|nr:hypothetical protein [Bacillota bacterium]
MITKLKIAAGLILIVVSFIYILRRPGVSMMESLMNHRQEQMEKLERQQAEEARLAAQDAQDAESDSDSQSQGCSE